MNIIALNEGISVLIKFDVFGNPRFLSHAEMVKVFQRACVRAGIKMQHSQGFNPRPKLSLPLPRSVGTETENDLLFFRMESLESLPLDTEALGAELCRQLPEGCKVVSVEITNGKTPPQHKQATYLLMVRQEYLNEELKAGIKHLLASKSLNIQRQVNAKGNTRDIDVRRFLKSIELYDKSLSVECIISPNGSIRIGEILELLGLDTDKLAAPVRRTNIQWQQV